MKSFAKTLALLLAACFALAACEKSPHTERAEKRAAERAVENKAAAEKRNR